MRQTLAALNVAAPRRRAPGENATVATALLSDLVDRGLDTRASR
jgi:hypothetical protein